MYKINLKGLSVDGLSVDGLNTDHFITNRDFILEINSNGDSNDDINTGNNTNIKNHHTISNWIFCISEILILLLNIY